LQQLIHGIEFQRHPVSGYNGQASAVQQLTASIEHISVQTTQNAKNAEDANKLASSARSNAEQGNIQCRTC
jgi:methyl-accepting chemotaxis protein